jgi:hypothetical protein
MARPWQHVHPGTDDPESIRSFLEQHRIRTLNIAGPRVSTDPRIYQYVFAVLERLAAS